MSPEELFIETLDDLSSRVNSANNYDILVCSSLIRKLYLDDTPLVHQVNKHIKLKLEYTIGNVQPPTGDLLNNLKIWSEIEGIEPDIDIATNVILKEDAFFKTIIGISDNHKYTIKDTIKYVANVMGGVHSGSPKDEKERALLELNNFYILDTSIILRQIQSISKVILQSLRRLKEVILKYDDFNDAPGIGIHMDLILFQLRDRNNFIFDFGIEEKKNRFFAYVSSSNELCFRLYDNNGAYYSITGGVADAAFSYEKEFYLAFEIAVLPNRFLLQIDLGLWSFSKIYNTSILLPENLHFVEGSDLFGVEHTNMGVFKKAIYFPKRSDDKTAVHNYFIKGQIERKADPNSKHIRFQGNKFLYSNDHPNFKNRKPE